MSSRFAIAIVLLVLSAPACTSAEIDVGAFLKEAEEAAEKLEVDRPSLLCDLARQYAGRGERLKAKKMLERAIKLALETPTTEKNWMGKWFLLKDAVKVQAFLGEVTEALKNATAVGASLHRVGLVESEVAEGQAEAGDFKGAVATCDRLIAPVVQGWKAMSLCEIAWAQAKVGQFDASLQTVKLIEALPAKDDETRRMNRASRNNALAIIAREQATHGHVKEGLLTAERDSRDSVRAVNLRDIARIQAERGDKPGAKETVRRALRLAERLNDADCIETIAGVQAEIGDISGALETTSRFLKGPAKGYVLLLISIAEMKIGERVDAAKKFEEGLTIARIDGTEGRLLECVSGKQAEAGDFDRAIKIAEAIRNPSTKAVALREIVVQVLKQRDIPQALKIADSIKDAFHRSFALRKIAVAQAKAKLPSAKETFRQAIESAKSEENKGGAIVALYQVGYAEGQAGYVADATKTFDEARRRALQEKDPAEAASLLQDIARAQAAGGNPSGALAWARSQSSQLFKARSLVGLVQGLTEGPDGRDP